MQTRLGIRRHTRRYRIQSLTRTALTMPATLAALEIDPAAEVSRILGVLRKQLSTSLKRPGLVVGMSGGAEPVMVTHSMEKV